MRRFLWFGLFLCILGGLVAAVLVGVAASRVPRLETAFDLEPLLRLSVEGERLSLQLEQVAARQAFAWERPRLEQYPAELVSLYLTQLGCPGFLKLPKEEGFAWYRRLVRAGLGMGMGGGGDGACELYLSRRLALAAGIAGEMESLVAANRIHGFMSKEELLAYDLSTMQFQRGLVGVESAAQVLLGKPLDQFTLAEMAEFALALPGVGGLWLSIYGCENAALIRQNRDIVLERGVALGLLPAKGVSAALVESVACLRKP